MFCVVSIEVTMGLLGTVGYSWWLPSVPIKGKKSPPGTKIKKQIVVVCLEVGFKVG